MSVHVLSRVIQGSRSSSTELVVMMLLADRAGDDGVCYPGMDTLARDARCDERHARRIIRKLAASGEIYVEHGGGRKQTNLYMVTVGLDADAIAGVLVRRFGMSVSDAMSTAIAIVARQNPDIYASVSGNENGDIHAQTRTSAPVFLETKTGTSTRETGTSTSETGTSRPPGPLYNHHEPSVIEDGASPPPSEPPAWYEDAHATPEPVHAPEPPTPRTLAQQPAIAMYRNAFLRFPPKAQMVWLAGQEITDLRRWRDVLTLWVGRGWSPTNISGMVDLYRNPARIQEQSAYRPASSSRTETARTRVERVAEGWDEWLADVTNGVA